MADTLPVDESASNLLREISEEMTHEQKLNVLISIVAKLAKDLHTVKGGLAANTSITMGVAQSQQQISSIISSIDFQLLADSLTAIASMKGGFRVLGWLERPAKWFAAVAAAAGTAYAYWSHK